MYLLCLLRFPNSYYFAFYLCTVSISKSLMSFAGWLPEIVINHKVHTCCPKNSTTLKCSLNALTYTSRVFEACLSVARHPLRNV